MKKRLLWVGDAACPSGFARATHEILEVARHTFDVTVLGLNYRGDPHTYPYPIYAAAAGGDAFGLCRLVWMCDLVKPDVIVVQNDPWNFPMYTKHLAQFKEYASVPVVGSVAVDGKNCQGFALNGLALAIFWTQFGFDEAKAGGLTQPGCVVPLGVDTDVFHPMDRYDARLRRGLPRELDDAFIVGNVNRNQPRKRWDLTVKYFAEWVRSCKIDDAYLFLHTAPTGDMGVNVDQLAAYYGVKDRLILVQPPTWYGVPDSEMRDTYNCFDVQISTTQGEGFGLTTFEGMACGVPQIVPNWSALGELTKDAAVLVPCHQTAVGPPYVNVLGGVADEDEFVKGLDDYYKDQGMRAWFSTAGLARVNEDRFRWANVGHKFTEAIADVVNVRRSGTLEVDVPLQLVK